MKDVKQIVTNRIIEALESSEYRLDWAKWMAASVNPVSGTVYSGVNRVLLSLSAERNGYEKRSWMTFKQAKQKGGYVKKGEKATEVVYASTVNYLDGKRVEVKDVPEDKRKDVKSVYFLRFYYVFNVAQIEGLPEEYYRIESQNRDERMDKVEAFADKFREGGYLVESLNDKAFYRQSEDKVYMPDFRQFKTADDYYLVLFHELTHWAGGNGKNRLMRKKYSKYELEGYAFEELIAEMGAGILAYEFGLDEETATNENAAYVRSWLQALKNDTSFIFRAASAAEKSAKFLIDYKKGDA